MSAAGDIVRDIYARLNASVGGGLLFEWHMESQPVAVVEAGADYPSLHVGLPRLGEESLGSNLATEIVMFTFAVSSKRQSSEEAVQDIQEEVAKHLDFLKAIQNSVELNTADPRLSDPLLNGRLLEPMRWDVGTVNINAGSYGTELRLTMRSRAVNRGAR